MKHSIASKLQLKTLLALALVWGGFLAACSSNAVNRNNSSTTGTPTATAIANEEMNHGMDHSNMELGPADADYDLRFIDAMIPHHEGATIMAKEVLQKSQRPELRKLAEAIISAQEKEIAQMKAWRKAWYPKAPSTPMAWHASMNHMMAMSEEQIKAMRMDMDLGAADAEFDRRFIDAMIPHHEAAVTMAKDMAQKSKRPQMQKLAQDIITSQAGEIQQMKQWKNAWYK